MFTAVKKPAWRQVRGDARSIASAPRRSVAERRRALVADPVPHRDGALHLGPADQTALVEFLGVEADRTHVVAAAGCLVSLHQVGQGRAALAGDPDRDACLLYTS